MLYGDNIEALPLLVCLKPIVTAGRVRDSVTRLTLSAVRVKSSLIWNV